MNFLRACFSMFFVFFRASMGVFCRQIVCLYHHLLPPPRIEYRRPSLRLEGTALLNRLLCGLSTGTWTIVFCVLKMMKVLLWRLTTDNLRYTFQIEDVVRFSVNNVHSITRICGNVSFVRQPGDVLSVWSIDGHPEWACRWHFASVGGEDLARFEPDQLPFHLSPIHQVRKTITVK